jgi:hypothetical protein
MRFASGRLAPASAWHRLPRLELACPTNTRPINNGGRAGAGALRPRRAPSTTRRAALRLDALRADCLCGRRVGADSPRGGRRAAARLIEASPVLAESSSVPQPSGPPPPLPVGCVHEHAHSASAPRDATTSHVVRRPTTRDARDPPDHHSARSAFVLCTARADLRQRTCAGAADTHPNARGQPKPRMLSNDRARMCECSRARSPRPWRLVARPRVRCNS